MQNLEKALDETRKGKLADSWQSIHKVFNDLNNPQVFFEISSKKSFDLLTNIIETIEKGTQAQIAKDVPEFEDLASKVDTMASYLLTFLSRVPKNSEFLKGKPVELALDKSLKIQESIDGKHIQEVFYFWEIIYRFISANNCVESFLSVPCSLKRTVAVLNKVTITKQTDSSPNEFTLLKNLIFPLSTIGILCQNAKNDPNDTVLAELVEKYNLIDVIFKVFLFVRNKQKQGANNSEFLATFDNIFKLICQIYIFIVQNDDYAAEFFKKRTKFMTEVEKIIQNDGNVALFPETAKQFEKLLSFQQIFLENFPPNQKEDDNLPSNPSKTAESGQEQQPEPKDTEKPSESVVEKEDFVKNKMVNGWPPLYGENEENEENDIDNSSSSSSSSDEQSIPKVLDSQKEKTETKQILDPKSNKFEEKRKKIVEELRKTEDAYVEGLKCFKMNYIDPIIENGLLISSGNAISPRNPPQTAKTPQICVKNSTFNENLGNIPIPLALGFENAKKILKVNQAFNESLQNLFQKPEFWEENGKNQEIMLSKLFIQKSRDFEVYTTFVNNYDAAEAETYNQLKCKPQFREFLDKTSLDLKEKGFRQADFLTFLITPVQRLPRYQLILSELLENLSKSNEMLNSNEKNVSGKIFLEQAIREIKKTTRFLNERKRDSQNREIALKLTKKYDLKPEKNFKRVFRQEAKCKFFTVRAPNDSSDYNQQLNNEGSLNTTRSEKLSPRTSRSYTSTSPKNAKILLFNDLLVLRKRGFLKKTFQFPLKSLTLGKGASIAENSNENSILIFSPEEGEYELIFKEKPERDHFFTALNNELLNSLDL